MATQRPAFAKRDREMKLKDKARAKAERRAARRAAPRPGHGPPIESDDPGDEATASADPVGEATASTAPAATAPEGSTTPKRPE